MISTLRAAASRRGLPRFAPHGGSLLPTTRPKSSAASSAAAEEVSWDDGDDRHNGAEASQKHVPFGESGTGHYSDATKGCFDVMNRLATCVHDSLADVLDHRAATGVAGATPFRLLDLGTADAGTSLALVRDVVQAVRAREGPDTPFEIVYEDQPGNDWVSVFRRTSGAIPTEGMQRGGGGDGNPDPFAGLGAPVHVLASGTSFYHSCVSPGTVDLAFCSTAMHWLRAAPIRIPDALHSACTADEDARAAFAAQAAGDWTAILRRRAEELKTGGALVVANFAVDGQGQFLGRTGRVGACMHSQFADIWEALVTPEEFAATNFPNQYRTLEECVAPLRRDDNVFLADEALRQLKLVSAETDVVACPFYDAYHRQQQQQQQRGGGELSAEEHAARYVPTTRTWSNSTFEAGLDDSRSTAEKAALVDELFQEYERRVAAHPEAHAMDYVHSYLRVQKWPSL